MNQRAQQCVGQVFNMPHDRRQVENLPHNLTQWIYVHLRHAELHLSFLQIDSS